jgi:hypothetical protein
VNGRSQKQSICGTRGLQELPEAFAAEQFLPIIAMINRSLTI